MRFTPACLVFLAGCAAAPLGQSSENEGRAPTDSNVPSALTDIQATAENEAETIGTVPLTAKAVDGALRVRMQVPEMTECTFGQTNVMVNGAGDLVLDLDEKDTHDFLFSGASIACEGGEQPLFAWSLLDAKVSAPKIDLALDEEADAMLSESDRYVVRVRGQAFEPVRDAKLEIDGTKYTAKVTELRDEITHWEVTFDVPSDKWVGAALNGNQAARLLAHLDSKDVDARVTIGFDARIRDLSRQPLEND